MVCDDTAGTGKIGRPSKYSINVIDAGSKVNSEELKRLIAEAIEKGKHHTLRI
jgi:hypothetical protein